MALISSNFISKIDSFVRGKYVDQEFETKRELSVFEKPSKKYHPTTDIFIKLNDYERWSGRYYGKKYLENGKWRCKIIAQTELKGCSVTISNI